jgi:hypothetical protein
MASAKVERRDGKAVLFHPDGVRERRPVGAPTAARRLVGGDNLTNPKEAPRLAASFISNKHKSRCHLFAVLNHSPRCGGMSAKQDEPT